MKSILLHIYDDVDLGHRVAAAIALARAFDAEVACLQVTPLPDYITVDPFGGMYAYQPIMDEIRERETHIRERTLAQIDGAGLRSIWEQVDGNIAAGLIEAGALNDVTILSQPRRGHCEGIRPVKVIPEVATKGVAPVLALPAGEHRVDPQAVAAIAWNGSAQSARALRASLPLVARAAEVHLIEVTGRHHAIAVEAAARFLELRGITAAIRKVDSDGRAVSDALRDATLALGAGLLVMGAYGHSRMTEIVLGGVSNDLVGWMPIPLLLAH